MAMKTPESQRVGPKHRVADVGPAQAVSSTGHQGKRHNRTRLMVGGWGFILVAFISSVSMTKEEVTYVSFWYQNASVQGSHWSHLGIPPVARTRHSTE